MLVPGVPGNPGHYPFSGMELLRSRRKWELRSCQHCCHFASQPLVREMPVQRLIDESLLDAVTTRQRVGRGLLQRCRWLILQHQAAVTEHWSVTRLSHLQSKNICCLLLSNDGGLCWDKNEGVWQHFLREGWTVSTMQTLQNETENCWGLN